jgi:hypothetical protein
VNRHFASSLSLCLQIFLPNQDSRKGATRPLCLTPLAVNKNLKASSGAVAEMAAMHHRHLGLRPSQMSLLLWPYAGGGYPFISGRCSLFPLSAWTLGALRTYERPSSPRAPVNRALDGGFRRRSGHRPRSQSGPIPYAQRPKVSLAQGTLPL